MGILDMQEDGTLDDAMQDNLIQLGVRNIQEKIKKVLIEEGMADAMKAFEESLRPLVEKQVNKLMMDVEKLRDITQLRDELHIYLSWKGETNPVPDHPPHSDSVDAS